MNVLVLNGSPSGENSITLYTVHYIAEQFPDCTFETLNVGQQIRKLEQDKASYLSRLEQADLLLFTYPVYTFLVPSQLHRFIELMKASGLDLSGKWAAQITTSKHFYDVTAHKFIEENCKDLGLKYIGGLSADMEDLLTKKGRKEAYAFFHFVRWNMIKEGRRNPSHQEGSVVIVTDSEGLQESPLQNMIAAFRAVLPIETTVVDLHEFPFAGGCLGCFNCAADGTCIYKDGFDTYLREHIQSADAIVYAYTIRDHSMGHRFKVYDDRQFCNGHRTVTMGKPVGYLVEGALEQEANLQMYDGLYPAVCAGKNVARLFYPSYVKTYLEKDVRDLLKIKDQMQFMKFMKLCAARIGSLFNATEIGAEVGVDKNTINHWLSVLQASYLVTLLPPYYENISKRIVKTPKLYFNDPGLACYLLDIESPRQLELDKMRGAIFENMIVMECLKHRANQGKEGNVFFYRDNHQNEVDILVKEEGQLYAIEVKSAMTYQATFEKTLRKLPEWTGTPIARRAVVYTGDFENTAGEVWLLNYKHLTQLWK